MWAQTFLTAALTVGVLLWLSGALGGRSSRPPALALVLRRVARPLRGEIDGDELRFEIQGAPARIVAEAAGAVLRVDLSCLRGARHLRAMRALLRDAPNARLSRHVLCLPLGRVPTVRRILGCVDHARRLVPKLMEAALAASRGPYRDLTGSRFSTIRPQPMANYPVWNVRRRHEWLARPAKGKRVKRRSALRIGLQDARDRNAKTPPAETQEPPTNTEA